MRRHVTGLVLVACLVAALSVSSSATATVSAEKNKAISTTNGLLRGDLGAARRSAKATARVALRKNASKLGIDASNFRFDSVRHSIVGRHVRGAQYVGGLKVDGSDAIVSIVEGRIVWVQAHQVNASGGPAASPVSADVARRAALSYFGVGSAARISIERVLVPSGGVLVDTYRVTVFSLRPALAATVDVSAVTGRVLATRDSSLYDNAVATLFDPNPIVSTKNNTLREPGVDESGVDTDLDSVALTAALEDLPILDYDPQQALAGRLVGPWVNVQGPAPMVQLTTGRFNYTRSDVRFEALMGYAHIDRYQRYLQNTLGFIGDAAINAESQDLYALPVQGFDNSFYQPGNDLMLLGAGGVDDGEDAEVILHEYGHAVQDAQVEGWGNTAEGGAMGEGFGDFQSAAYYARASEGFQDECLMDWDSTSYSSTNPPCIRRTDSPKHYPEDIENEVHADGEIWATYLWNVRDVLVTTEEAALLTPQEIAISKSDRSLMLVLTSHEFLTSNARFGDAVLALFEAADALGHPEWKAAIQTSAEAIGLPTS